MKIIVYLVALTVLFSCEKDRSCPDSVDVKLRNLTGLDGCGWVFELNDGAKLEPVNLSDFQLDLVEGKCFSIAYEDAEAFSICMVGKTVSITCVVEK